VPSVPFVSAFQTLLHVGYSAVNTHSACVGWLRSLASDVKDYEFADIVENIFLFNDQINLDQQDHLAPSVLTTAYRRSSSTSNNTCLRNQ